MNNEQARAPKLSDTKWGAIDVFLFANGQCTSPPRKYHLSSEQLSSWDITLNYMARTLYGWQIPKVELYDIDGVKVETPLELKNGSAYIAVPPSEVFKPAGYDKYLMKAIKNILFHRSGENTKQERRSCCSVACRFSDQGLNDAKAGIGQPNEIPKMIANLTDILNGTDSILAGNDLRAAATTNTDGRQDTFIKTQEDQARTAKPNALIVKPQKQTRTIFKRSLTPQAKKRDVPKQESYKPTPGKINTNPNNCKPKLFKSPAKITPKPTHKLGNTLTSNFESIPDDILEEKNIFKPHLSYKSDKYSENAEKTLSVLKLVSLGNSHEAIHTIKPETSDLNKHSSVPNLFHPEANTPVNHKYTSTTTIVVQKNIEQGTTMSNKNLKISNDALISLNKEEFQMIVDRIVERILDEKAHNSNQKVAAVKDKPKLVYAKVVQSPTRDGSNYNRSGRVVTIMNENEVVNFKVNIEVANIDENTKSSWGNERRKRNASLISEYITSSSTLEDSCCYCNNSCECQCLDVQPIFYRKPQVNKSILQNTVDSSVSKSQSNQGDVRNESKDKPKDSTKTAEKHDSTAAPAPNSNNKKNKSKLSKKDDSKTNLLDAKSALKTPNSNQKPSEHLDESTQTEGLSEILLEAKEHSDGRYTFHLPPLNVLRYYNI